MTLPPVDLLLHTYSFRFAFGHDPRFDVIAFLDRAVADGYTGVALNVNGPRYRFLGGDEPAHVARVADAVRARGLDLDIETSGTAPDHLATLLDLAGRLGARNLRTYTRHAGPRPDVVARTVDDLRHAGPRAEAAGIAILLENHEEFTGLELARILEAVDHPAVGALYDYGNSMMVGEDPLDALDAMLPWTRKAHLKDHVLLAADDAPGGAPLVAGVPMGDGVLPIVEQTRRLLAAGVTRIAFENVWSYTCGLRDREDGRARAPLGDGAFSFRRPPWPPELLLADIAGALADDPQRVVALEEHAYLRGRAWLDAALRSAGIAVRGRAPREESRP